jgi:hypothetical protein
VRGSSKKRDDAKLLDIPNDQYIVTRRGTNRDFHTL